MGNLKLGRSYLITSVHLVGSCFVYNDLKDIHQKRNRYPGVNLFPNMTVKVKVRKRESMYRN